MTESNGCGRSADYLDRDTLTYVEVKAFASGNPLILDKFKIDTELKQLYLSKTRYDKLDEQLNCQFEQLRFNEKRDVFSEIIIKYDNATYFNARITMLQFESKLVGYNIANEIMKLKI